MKLATIRTPAGTRAVRVDDDRAVEIDPSHGVDVGALLTHPAWRDVAAAADGPTHPFGDADLAAVIPGPGKIICVGLNYRQHILEMGRELPEYPTLFAKYTDTLTGPHDALVLPVEDHAIDWEAELVVVIGATVRHADGTRAEQAIAGYTVANDVSMRTWQFRTKEWLQGKMWEASTPLGPVMVTTDEWTPGPAVHAEVNGTPMQRAETSDLVHGPVDLVRYVSTMITLRPGDIILTGTPGGVGHARKPPQYLQDGDIVTTGIDGIGELRNTVTAVATAAATG